jgi:hypothetical protein
VMPKTLSEVELRKRRQEAVVAIVNAARGFPKSELAALVALLAAELAGIRAHHVPAVRTDSRPA